MHAVSINQITDILHFNDKCMNKIFQNPESSVNGISKNDFHLLLNFTTK